MKPSELKRFTPLTSQTPLRRTAMARSKRTNRKGWPKLRYTGPSDAVRKLVRVRSDGWCEWPGCWLVAADQHHRLNRKSGGRHGEMAVRINQAGWLLDACRPHHDLVTSPVGADRVLARRMGWLLYEGEDALTTPVESRHGLVLLLNDGTVSEVGR